MPVSVTGAAGAGCRLATGVRGRGATGSAGVHPWPGFKLWYARVVYAFELKDFELKRVVRQDSRVELLEVRIRCPFSFHVP